MMVNQYRDIALSMASSDNLTMVDVKKNDIVYSCSKGIDIINWIQKNIKVSKEEAKSIAQRMKNLDILVTFDKNISKFKRKLMYHFHKSIREQCLSNSQNMEKKLEKIIDAQDNLTTDDMDTGDGNLNKSREKQLRRISIPIPVNYSIKANTVKISNTQRKFSRIQSKIGELNLLEKIKFEQLILGEKVFYYSQKGKVHEGQISVTTDYYFINCNKLKIGVEEVIEIRKGHSTEVLMKYGKESTEKFCVSIIYSEGKKILDLQFLSEERACLYSKSLQSLLNYVKENHETHFAYKHWKECKTVFDKISIAQLIRALKKLGLNTSTHLLTPFIKELNFGNTDNYYGFSEFTTILKKLMSRPLVADLFARNSKNGKMSYANFSSFLERNQWQVADEDTKIVFENFSNADDKSFLTLEEFENYMISDYNSGFKREKKLLYQNMNHPMTHYWISSSHNTYLEGDQLTSKSSVEMYIKSLQDGFRCVELDIWDGPNGEPIIYHGHTLTSKILFEDAVKVIKENAFTKNPYPVILSLENHCSLPQQVLMAKYMKEIFGEKLQMPIKSKDYLPSPEELKGKILIKGSVDHFPPGEEEEDKEKQNNSTNDLNNSRDNVKEKDFKFCPELTEITFFCSNPFKLNAERSSIQSHMMSSFAEAKALNLSTKSRFHYLNYNVKQMSRIYPSGTRMDSSNYDPVPMWNSGCQMVALNYQTKKFPIFINQTKFMENGQTGWVLKPEYMRYYDREIPHGKFGKVKIRILDARLLDNTLDKNTQPFVVLTMEGVPEDKKTFKTNIVEGTLKPVWDEEFEFNLTQSELAILMIEIYSKNVKDNTYLCHTGVPVECLASGYRVLHLYNRYNKLIDNGLCNLFCHITVEMSDNFLKEREFNSVKNQLRESTYKNFKLEGQVNKQQLELNQMKKVMEFKEIENQMLKSEITKLRNKLKENDIPFELGNILLNYDKSESPRGTKNESGSMSYIEKSHKNSMGLLKDKDTETPEDLKEKRLKIIERGSLNETIVSYPYLETSLLETSAKVLQENIITDSQFLIINHDDHDQNHREKNVKGGDLYQFSSAKDSLGRLKIQGEEVVIENFLSCDDDDDSESTDEN